MDWDIDWINSTEPTVNYEDLVEYTEAPIPVFIARFEAEMGVSGGDDIGGLIVYSNDCVYDYENLVGWVR